MKVFYKAYFACHRIYAHIILHAILLLVLIISPHCHSPTLVTTNLFSVFVIGNNALSNSLHPWQKWNLSVDLGCFICLLARKLKIVITLLTGLYFPCLWFITSLKYSKYLGLFLFVCFIISSDRCLKISIIFRGLF